MIEDDQSESHSYFIPMVDMLAGVVFILVIMLASVTVVSRQDFAAASSAEQEISEIEKELAAARAVEQAVLVPRRDADAALRLLLARLEDGLSAAGFQSRVDAGAGRLTLDEEALFQPAGIALSARGTALAQTLSGLLARELPCLAENAAQAPACVDYPRARLDRAVVAAQAAPRTVPDQAAPASEALALGVLSAVVGATPELLKLRSADGEPLLAYRGLLDGPEQRVPLAGDAKLGGRDARLVLAFQMDVPPLPPPSSAP
jgi:hypothetical protein